MEELPVFDRVSLDYDTTQPELAVTIDREAASDLGVSVDTLGDDARRRCSTDARWANTTSTATPFPVRAAAPDGMIDDPSDLENIFVRTAGGRMVPLSSFVTVTERAVAPELPREGLRRAVPMTAELAPGVDLRQAMNALDAARGEASCRPAMGIRFTGEAATLERDVAAAWRSPSRFALVVVLLVLAAQFESFISADHHHVHRAVRARRRRSSPSRSPAARSTSTARSASSCWSASWRRTAS